MEKATRIVEHSKAREHKARQEAEAARAAELAAMERERLYTQTLDLAPRNPSSSVGAPTIMPAPQAR